MKQFLLPHGPDSQGIIRLGGRDFHYLARVRRLSMGQELPCKDPQGPLYTMRVQGLGPDWIELSMVETLSSSRPKNLHDHQVPKFYLVQGLPKASKMDQIIRQACELGVQGIIPTKMEHCEVDLGEKESKKHERWSKIIREAFQQAGLDHMPILEPGQTLKDLCLYFKNNQHQGWLGFFFHEIPQSNLTIHQEVHRYLRSTTQASPEDTRVYLVIGPEGGLSPHETTMLTDAGFLPAWLGPSVLRTETAAIAALSALRLLFLEEHTWEPKNLASS